MICVFFHQNVTGRRTLLKGTGAKGNGSEDAHVEVQGVRLKIKV